MGGVSGGEVVRVHDARSVDVLRRLELVRRQWLTGWIATAAKKNNAFDFRPANSLSDLRKAGHPTIGNMLCPVTRLMYPS